MHKAIAFYTRVMREYQLFTKAIQKNSLNENHEQWKIYLKFCTEFNYPKNIFGYKNFREDLIKCEMI